jgi:hypothetical protein
LQVKETVRSTHPLAASMVAAVIAAPLWLAACGPDSATRIAPQGRDAAKASEAAYRVPPSLTSSVRLAGGRLLLEGRATPRAQVRLATPAGVEITAPVNAAGHWRATAPAAPGVRLMGLSMREGGRTIQAEGYLALTPQGAAAQLRAGAGALVLAATGQGPKVFAIDFDQQGGAVVSGVGRAGEALSVAVDGTVRAKTATDRGGRFSIALNEPLAPGEHRLEIAGADGAWRGDVTISPPELPAGAPFRAVWQAPAWRIDWTTPGGGVQTTVLFSPRSAGA